jgi:hypothetical protein
LSLITPAWYEMEKGGATTDGDIARRRVFAVDCDVVRPSKISATDEQMGASVRVALAVHEYLVPIIGEDAIAYVHSGNGRQLWVALDVIEANEGTKRAIGVVLASLHQKFSTAEVKIDTSLSDHKRLLPACGTVKKKGAAGIAERPHRRTAIVVPDNVQRLSLAALIALGERVRSDLDETGRAAVDKATAVKPAGVKHAGHTSGAVPRQVRTPFDVANALDTQQVAEWLSVFQDGVLHCPGCDETAGVDILDHGLKCLHDRCQDKGRKGFRTNVDLVMEVRDVGVRDAYELIAERFGLKSLQTPPEVLDSFAKRLLPSRRDAGTADEPPPGFYEGEAPQEGAPPRAPLTPVEVLDRLAAQGPAIHIPTGLAQLDKLTGGGPRLGDLVAVLGAPDVAKTMLCVWLSDEWASRACVGLLAIDEDDEGIVTRLAQRRGWDRPEVERRERFDQLRGCMPSLHIYDGSWSLVAAIEDLAGRSAGRPVILICDSLQTIAEGSSTGDDTQAQAVSRTLAALRTAARDRRWLVVVTSEMVRSAYSGSGERTSTLAAGKWSGSIEYAAKLLLALKPIEGEPDLVKVEIAKNKLGPHGELHLRIDRASQNVTAEEAPAFLGGQGTVDAAVTSAKHALRITSFLSARGGRFVGNKGALQQAIGMQRQAFFRAFSTLEGVRVRSTPASDSTAAQIVLLPEKNDDRTDRTDSTAAVPSTGSTVPSPLKGAVLGTEGGGDARRAAEEQTRRTQATGDAQTLQKIPVKQRRAWMLAEGWSKGRRDRALALLSLQPKPKAKKVGSDGSGASLVAERSGRSGRSGRARR